MGNKLKDLVLLASQLATVNIINASSAFIATLFISYLGKEALAANAIISTTWNFIINLGIPLLLPVSILISNLFGSKKAMAIGQVVRNGLYLAALVACPIILIMLNITYILNYFNQPPVLVEIVSSYFYILSFGVLPTLCHIVLKNLYIGISRAYIVLYFSILAVALEIVLSYLLMFGKLGLPCLGFNGIAYAMAIASWIIFIFNIFYLSCSKYYKAFFLFTFHNTQGEKYIKNMIFIGVPVVAQYAIELSSLNLIIYWMGQFGVIPLAAMQITLQFNIVALMIIVAVGQATSVLVAQSYGDNNIIMAKKTAFFGINLGAACMICIAFLYYYFPKFLINIYVDAAEFDNNELTLLTAKLLSIGGLIQIFESIRIISISALQGFYDTRVPMFISFIAYWFVTIPSSYALGFLFFHGPYGLLFGVLIGIAFGALISLLRVYKISPKPHIYNKASILS